MIYSMKTIIRQSLPVLLLAGALSIAAGLVLHNNSEMLFALPGILAIVPSFNNTGGSVTAILSCRLSSALHMGLIHPKIKRTKTLQRNIIATLIIAVLSFLALGFIAAGLNMVIGLGSINMISFMIIVLIAGFLTVLILLTLSVILSYATYSRGIDPDNMVIPILTSVGDLIGVVLLFVMLTMVI